MRCVLKIVMMMCCMFMSTFLCGLWRSNATRSSSNLTFQHSGLPSIWNVGKYRYPSFLLAWPCFNAAVRVGVSLCGTVLMFFVSLSIWLWAFVCTLLSRFDRVLRMVTLPLNLVWYRPYLHRTIFDWKKTGEANIFGYAWTSFDSYVVESVVTEKLAYDSCFIPHLKWGIVVVSLLCMTRVTLVSRVYWQMVIEVKRICLVKMRRWGEAIQATWLDGTISTTMFDSGSGMFVTCQMDTDEVCWRPITMWYTEASAGDFYSSRRFTFQWSFQFVKQCQTLHTGWL